MKTTHTKSMAFALVCSYALTGFSQTPDWNTQSPGGITPPTYRDGKVGIGTGYLPDIGSSWNMNPQTGLQNALNTPRLSPPLEVNSNATLGQNIYDAELLSSFAIKNVSLSQPGLWFRHNTWAVRTIYTNSGWNFKLHDGISVGNWYTDPGLNTLTWYEREPDQGLHRWGGWNSSYMTLQYGKLAIGMNLVPTGAIMEACETSPLGSALGSKVLLTKVGANAGWNQCNDNIWMIRNNNPNTPGVYVSQTTSWQDVSFHDGISVGNVYNNPGLDTRTWWERNPNADVQSWGNANKAYMQLDKGRLIIGKPLLPGNQHVNTFSLSVKGQIICTEVVVTGINNWADFVFDKDYQLMPLNELESYYKDNHHLPNVPSAKEIEESGNDLGKTDAVLLQKIEELTLYIVELQKQVSDLRKKND